MEGKDSIKDLFGERLINHEVPVNPELWSSIASQIPTVGSTSIATGSGLSTKILIAISIAASVGTGIYFLKTKNQERELENPTKGSSQTTSSKKEDSDKKIERSNLEIKILSQSEQLKTELQAEGQNDVNTEEINVPDKTEATYTTQKDKNIHQNNNVAEVPISVKEVTRSENKVSEVPTTNSAITAVIAQNSISSTDNNSNIIPKESLLNVVLPNIFTPNGDGRNDFLELTIEGVTDFSVVVLDNMGKVIYQSEDVRFKWDGTLPNGEKAPKGHYVYYITGKDSEGKLISKHSRLTISN